MHFTVLFHVERATCNVERLIGQRLSQFFERPRPVIAVVPKLHVGVLRRVEGTMLLIRQDFQHPAHDSLRHLLEQRMSEPRVASRYAWSSSELSYAIFSKCGTIQRSSTA